MTFGFTSGKLKSKGNTEGSRGLVVQTVHLAKYKLGLTLNQTQSSVLVGSILGDGTLRIGKDAINANFKVEHSLKQKDYVFWKYDLFKEWVTTPPKLSFRYNENRIPYSKSWWFRTIRHPKLTLFHKLFYRDGIKIVPKKIMNLLDPLALAVWIMDDGSLNGNKIDLSTYSFKLEEIKLLQTVFLAKFALKSSFYKDRDKGLRMYFSKQETQKFIPLISPFIIPSLAYKVPLTP